MNLLILQCHGLEHHRQPQNAPPQKWQCSAQRQPQGGEDSCQGVVLSGAIATTGMGAHGLGMEIQPQESLNHQYFTVNQQVLMDDLWLSLWLNC